MKFHIDMIYGDGSYDEKRPLAVHFTTDQAEPEDDYVHDLAAKHLRTFKSFREDVADELGLWLDDPTSGRSEAERREEWHGMVATAFAAGRRWKEQQEELAEKRENIKTPALDAARAAAARVPIEEVGV